ncbi:hypothetical protein [Actinoalloteichus fjordicus]|uniref:Uncharacterized protein n=1 Tax=Actinoalloteichus fjordicus TaxID=1612552 RepID=A0AAC9LA14_9PSEU|nr:hypothetical protein [Actinoalloteichus fjordicus]APU12782.1 hypothetical protein UA74_03505 [Actinoalloteichus fjordicus]
MSEPPGDRDGSGTAGAQHRDGTDPVLDSGSRSLSTGADVAVAAEPVLVDQIAVPSAGLFLQQHKVFVDEGETLPVDGDRAVALCGAWVLIGPPPAEVEPGVPGTHVEDCPGCRAIHLGEADIPAPDDAIRWFVRRVGTLPVHVIVGDGITATQLIARCGRAFRLGEPLERLAGGDGVPCTACLLASLPDPPVAPSGPSRVAPPSLIVSSPAVAEPSTTVRPTPAHAVERTPRSDTVTQRV